MSTKPLKVAFLHPDLGIGGAERLIVDAGTALQSKGHAVTMYTSHHTPSRAFPETRDGTLPVYVAGDWLPRHIAQRGHILFATLRSLWLALYVGLFGGRVDVFVVDQISACVPVLCMLRPATPVFFYCHFPDQLLTRRDSLLKTLYRLPFDAFEQLTTGLADRIAVNSTFTRGVFDATFRAIAVLHRPAVLYPALRVPPIPASRPGTVATNDARGRRFHTFVSINRFERKKNINLAIEAFAVLRARLEADGTSAARVRLVVAGGYDERVQENVAHYAELRALAETRGVLDGVRFLRSFSDEEKRNLLASATAVLYTPSNEHFGIVPIEAMGAARPVVAVASGGPLETVEDGVTGFLRAPEPAAFADAMERLVREGSLPEAMGREGRKRVIRLFSFAAFATRWDEEIRATHASRWHTLMAVLCLVAVAVTGAAAASVL